MKIKKFVIYSMLIAAALFGMSCSHKSHDEMAERHAGEHEESGEHDGDENETERAEHDREEGEGGEGEESGTELSLTQKYDEIRNGVRLIISYNEESNTFKGTVQNTTEVSIEDVRVEVHLSNGKELGPTKRLVLEAGATRDISLQATSSGFEGWTTHAEVGNEEHGEGEGEGHSEEGEGHSEEGEGHNDEGQEANLR